MYEYIEFIICYGEGLTPEQVKEPVRKHEVVFARQLIMYFSVIFNVGSYTYIADLTGGKDHSSVNHAMKTIRNYIVTDKKKKGKIEYYERLLRKILDLISKAENVKKVLKPLEEELSQLEQRCINLTLQLAFLKKETQSGTLKKVI